MSKTCPGCGTEFDNYTKYCSKSCSNSHQPRRKRKCADGVSTCRTPECECHSRLRPPCLVCGGVRGLYASKTCGQQRCIQTVYFAEKLSEDGFVKWLNGEVSATANAGRHGAKLFNWARRYLLEQAGHKCTRCGWSEKHPVTNTVPLEIDHIDGDTSNNFITNLRVLCPNCHALTPTYRRMNEKNRRARAGAGAAGLS